MALDREKAILERTAEAVPVSATDARGEHVSAEFLESALDGVDRRAFAPTLSRAVVDPSPFSPSAPMGLGPEAMQEWLRNREASDSVSKTTDAAARAQDKARKDAEARSQTAQHLVYLQGRLATLDAEIAVLDEKIGAFESRYFTDEQKAYFGSLPPEKRQAAKDEAMLEMLATGEITQEQYDQWKDWNETRADKDAERDRVQEVFENGTPEQIGRAAREANIDDARSQRDTLSEPGRERVEGVLEERYDTGNSARQNDGADFGVFSSDAGPLADAGPINSAFNAASAGQAHNAPSSDLDLAVHPGPPEKSLGLG